MPKQLPATASLEHLKNQAKSLLKALRSGHPEAAQRIQSSHPQYTQFPIPEIFASQIKLSESQMVIAREYGFASWPRLKHHVESLTPISDDLVSNFKRLVQERDANGLSKLLSSEPNAGALVNDPLFGFDAPAIVLAAGHGDKSTIDVLLAAGADPNTRSQWWAGGFGVLDSAEPELADYLIQNGATLDIHAASRLGLLDRVREIVARDPVLVNARGGDGMTPLHFASTIPICEFLLNQGAEIDIPDIDHNATAAQYAIAEIEKLRFLIDRGAKPDLFIACVLGDIEIARQILATNPDALSTRIGKGEFTGPGEHIYLYKIGYQTRPLSLAQTHGNRDFVAYLLSYASVKEKFLFACERADVRTAQSLVAEHPHLVKSLTPEEMSVISDCAWTNNYAAVAMMLDLGFDIDTKGVNESTPLDRAAIRGYAALVKMLLERGASRTVRNDFGGTPFRACLWGAENWHNGGDYAACIAAFLASGEPMPDDPAAAAVVAKVLKGSA